MPIPTNTQTTYPTIGNREDLADEIYRIDPTDTPFVNGIENETATFTNHEWQLQPLAAFGANAQFEGDAMTATAFTPSVRRGNILQISWKVPEVSETQQAMDHAGTGNEFDYQKMLKGLELKRDLEFVVTGANTAKNAGAVGTARLLASTLSWIKTNTSFGATGANPAAADGTGTRTDGTQRAFAEPLLKTVLQSIWTSGGKPDVIMTGAFNKQVFSTFTGRAMPTEDTRAKKITASVTAYDSDFGLLDIVPDRFIRARDVFIYQMNMWAMAYLKGRKFAVTPLAKVADADWAKVVCEYTLTARNEAASGGVFDLTTS